MNSDIIVEESGYFILYLNALSTFSDYIVLLFQFLMQDMNVSSLTVWYSYFYWSKWSEYVLRLSFTVRALHLDLWLLKKEEDADDESERMIEGVAEKR